MAAGAGLISCTVCTFCESIMPANLSYGLEQARSQLPSIIANAHAGVTSVSTRHGRPYAAVVPIASLEKSRKGLGAASGVLALRDTGQGLWGADVGRAVSDLRDEWGDDLGES